MICVLDHPNGRWEVSSWLSIVLTTKTQALHWLLEEEAVGALLMNIFAMTEKPVCHCRAKIVLRKLALTHSTGCSLGTTLGPFLTLPIHWYVGMLWMTCQ